MMISHRFASAATLDRALYWLGRHGFAVRHSDAAGHDASRVTLHLAMSRAPAAMALIDAIERSDPQGWPGVFDRPAAIPTLPRDARPEAETSSGATTPIHWQAREPHPAADPLCCKVCEYMLSRWE